MIYSNLNRKFFISSISIFLFILSGCSTTIYSKPDTTTTVIMIRHADRTAMGGQLTERGKKNAHRLIKEIGAMNITAIYSPDLVRNLDTVQPLAKHLGIRITKVQDDPDEQDIVIDIMGKHSGKTVLWVGNTTNLSGIYTLLGGTGESPVRYGDLFIIKVPDKGKSQIEKKRWGNN